MYLLNSTLKVEILALKIVYALFVPVGHKRSRPDREQLIRTQVFRGNFLCVHQYPVVYCKITISAPGLVPVMTLRPWVFGNDDMEREGRLQGMYKVGDAQHTICPRSSDPFCIIAYYIKWVNTSWTHSISLFKLFLWKNPSAHTRQEHLISYLGT